MDQPWLIVERTSRLLARPELVVGDATTDGSDTRADEGALRLLHRRDVTATLPRHERRVLDDDLARTVALEANDTEPRLLLAHALVDARSFTGTALGFDRCLLGLRRHGYAPFLLTTTPPIWTSYPAIARLLMMVQW